MLVLMTKIALLEDCFCPKVPDVSLMQLPDETRRRHHRRCCDFDFEYHYLDDHIHLFLAASDLEVVVVAWVVQRKIAIIAVPSLSLLLKKQTTGSFVGQ